MEATATPRECKRWSLKRGDVLFTKDSESPKEIGIAAYVADSMPNVLCGYHLAMARPRDGLLVGQYLTEALGSQASRKELARVANGTTRFGLTLNAIRSLPILLPPLSEQRAIAAVLDAVDEAIKCTEALIRATESLREALLNELLTQGVPGWHTKWNEVPSLGTVPASWAILRLGDTGTWLSGGTPSRACSHYWSGNLPWVSPKDMKGRELYDAREHISEEGARAGSRVAPEESIFVVVRGMILAHSFPMAVARVATAFNQDIRALVCHDELLPDFVLAALQHQKPRILQLPSPSTHGTMRLATEDLFGIPVPVPPASEQLAISTVLGRVDGAIDCIRTERDALLSSRARVADVLLTGRVKAARRIASG